MKRFIVFIFFGCFTLFPSAPLISEGNEKQIKVVIDPGHGGENMGALGYYGIYEKHITNSVSKKIKDKLERKGVNVFLTRDGDEFVALKERAEFANEKGADIFVSIHCNASQNPDVMGFETFFLSLETAEKDVEKEINIENKIWDVSLEKNLDTILKELKFQGNLNESLALAETILKELEKNLNESQSRGVRQGGFSVLRDLKMPGIVVEIGFITNPLEGLNLLLEEYQEKIAEIISNSIIKYSKKRFFIDVNEKK